MRSLALLMLTSLSLGAGSAAPLAAQQPATPAAPAHDADPDRMVQSTGLPAGWSGRTDRGQPLAGARFEAMANGWHVTTGPAVILYRGTDRAPGQWHTLATFTQTKAPTHPEGYGMFIGGNGLDTTTIAYTYILVRGDGVYLIKRRAGTAVTTLVDWTPSPAVHKADSAGKATNKIEAQYIDGKLAFSINGTEVYSANATPAEANGIIGLRVNHNLDVNVEGFAVHNIGGPANYNR